MAGNTSWAVADDKAVTQISAKLDNAFKKDTLAATGRDLFMRILAIVLTILSAPAMAHEFWIAPLDYQVAADTRLEADLVNGQEFAGAKIAYFPQRFVNFLMFQGDTVEKVRGRPGDRPALNQDAVGEGLHIVGYQANNDVVDYETLEKFEAFVIHKDLGDAIARHRARGLSEENFVELYSRYSKALIAVGHGEGADRRVGLETELVALKNPYTDDMSGGMQVQLFYRENLRSNEQVEVFEKDAAGRVAINLYRTDDKGIATFPVKPGHQYMVDAVVLREPSAEEAAASGAVWETLWANLTFAVPE